MKIIIFSDVHGNLEAFESFFGVLDGFEYERMYNLGDIIGYGADPNACVALLRDREIPSVTGNHEDAVLGRADPSGFNPDARRAVTWCREQLTQENLDYLRTIGDFMWVDSALGKTLLVHGSPVDKDEYLLNRRHAERAFESMTYKDISISFIGHTHRPCFWIQQPDGSAEFFPYDQEKTPVKLNPSLKVIVNAGSIGQPRDNNPMGCFVIWDDVKHTIEFRRFEYPIEKAQQKIYDAGLPRILADRLGEGY